MTDKFAEVRNEIMSKSKAFWESIGYDVLVTGSQEFAIPMVNAAGDEGYFKITFAVPKGSQDGDPYDGYEMADAYARKVAEAKAKAEKKAKDKAAKIARDEAMRAKKKQLAEARAIAQASSAKAEE